MYILFDLLDKYCGELPSQSLFYNKKKSQFPYYMEEVHSLASSSNV